MPSLAQNITSVKGRIAQAAKDANSSTKLPVLVAVSKTRTAKDVRLANDQGLTQFGENYLQEALEKIHACRDLPVIWHFIGSLQSNKTRQIAEHFDWVQTIDRVKIAQRLNDQRPPNLGELQVCLTVNLDDEDSKSGVAPEDLMELAEKVAQMERLKLRGLMCIPAPQDNIEKQRESCQKAADLYRLLMQRHPDIDTLSLGMSADLEAAISAGSTMVRIGTDIFGPRPTKKPVKT